MTVKVVVDGSFGDVGKGKVSDYLMQYADIGVRFNGGGNTGKTAVKNGIKTILHYLPTSVLHDKVSIIGNGCVIHPETFLKELRELKTNPLTTFVSENCHVILDRHIKEEQSTLSTLIGTTKKGVGYCYSDKAARTGVRLKDYLEYNLLMKEDLSAFCTVCDTVPILNTYIDLGKNIIMDGAQGTFLDVDHGFYPYVTSSNCVAGAACAGSGIGPTKIDEVIGVFKAYWTRVGEGPFPTEVFGESAEEIRRVGNEFGATTGRPRRIGQFDIGLAKRAVQLNGMTSFALTKLDVFDMISVDHITFIERADAFNFVGTTFSTEGIKLHKKKDFNYHENLFKIIRYLENKLGIPCALLGTGPDTEDMIDLYWRK